MNNNFKYFLSLFLLVSVVDLSVATNQVPIINIGSDSDRDRLFQVETTIDSQGKLLYQIQQQLSDTQRDIDALRGKIQENQHRLIQVIDRQKDLYIQLELLITDKSKVKTNTNNSNSYYTVTTSKPLNEKVEYDKVVALAIKSKSKQQIIQAINSFHNFIKTYPKSDYQSNVNYWLGQLSYNQENKDDAAFYFATVVKKHPNSLKAAESLYKIGLLMQDKGRNDKAYIIYQEVIKAYPGSPSAQLAQKKLANHLNCFSKKNCTFNKNK